MSNALPLNALRAFEASARHLSFTRAAEELHVTQAAVSHQVKALEARLGVKLFRRLPRSLLLTEEGQILLPELRDAFDRIAAALERVKETSGRGPIAVSLVATFALSWLVPRLPRFHAAHPDIELRLTTHNNRPVDFARDPVDMAVRYGYGVPHAEKLFDYRLTPLCSPRIAGRLKEPCDLEGLPLLCTGDRGDWPLWLRAAGLPPLPTGGTIFDSTRVMIEAAMEGVGVAIGSPYLFAGEIAQGDLVQPFALTVPNGRAYWLLLREGRAAAPPIQAFRDWLLAEAAGGG
jgi:LysR family transcriptional regulator, regulator of gene expression of beta-lactamase